MAETDDGIYLKKSGIDTSVGYLIVGLVVLLFFVVTVLGMGRLQHLSDEAGTTRRATAEEKAAEIGDKPAAATVE